MEDINLQEFIHQVKKDLLSPNPRLRFEDPHPLFIIDKIDLEIAVKAAKTKDGGIKIAVLGLEIGANRASSIEQTHVIRISLTPIISREELVNKVLSNPNTDITLLDLYSQRGLVKGDELEGEKE